MITIIFSRYLAGDIELECFLFTSFSFLYICDKYKYIEVNKMFYNRLFVHNTICIERDSNSIFVQFSIDVHRVLPY